MMTSFAFILGLLPLVIADGAGAAQPPRRRHARCSAACSPPRVFGIFVIPMLYVVFQWLREWTARRLFRTVISPLLPRLTGEGREGESHTRDV